MHKRIVVGTDGDFHDWPFSPSQYVKNVVNDVEKYLRGVKHIGMPRSMDTCISNGYQAKLDETA